VLQYIGEFTVQTRSPGYIFTDRDGRVIDSGGNLAAYGISDLRTGGFIGEQVSCLAGLLPLVGAAPMVFSCVGPESGSTADIHIFQGREGVWILLLDARADQAQRALLQQKSNELNLLRHRVSATLHEVAPKGLSTEAVEQFLELRQGAARREVAVLVAGIQGFSACAVNQSAAEVLKTLDQYRRTVMKTSIDEAGWLGSNWGEAVEAVFGILPAAAVPPNQAVRAALRMLDKVKRINWLRNKDGLGTCAIAVGIGTGPVVLGLLGSKRRKSLRVIGAPVDLAVRFYLQAPPGAILIDGRTYRQIEALQQHFAEIPGMAPGSDPDAAIFSNLHDQRVPTKHEKRPGGTDKPRLSF
jgi:class 3 adenylate cyclase